MMSGHGANPIFFNKKVQKQSLTPQPPTSDNISFLPYPPTPSPHSKWTLYVHQPLIILTQEMQTQAPLTNLLVKSDQEVSCLYIWNLFNPFMMEAVII